jgi:hypothetical protein
LARRDRCCLMGPIPCLAVLSEGLTCSHIGGGVGVIAELG